MQLGVRSKILVVFCIPMLVAVALAAVMGTSSITNAMRSYMISGIADQGDGAARLTSAIAMERNAAVMVIRSEGEAKEAFKKQLQSTRAALAAAGTTDAANDTARVGPLTSNAVEKQSNLLGNLTTARQLADAPDADPVKVEAAYTDLIRGITDVSHALSVEVDDPEVAGEVSIYNLMLQLQTAVADETLVVLQSLGTPMTAETRQRFAETLGAQKQLSEAVVFAAASHEHQVTLPELPGSIQAARTALLNAPVGEAPPLDMNAFAPAMQQYQQALLASSVDCATVASNVADSAKTAAVRDAAITVGLSLLTLIAGGIVAFFIMQSMTKRLISLEKAASHLCSMLPQLGAMVREKGANVEVPTIEVDGNDEISELGQTINSVRAAAVNSFIDQAATENSIASMFVNIARRDQVLLGRQMALLDELEQNETQPDNLSHLFSLDHLATRMRRNAESLLVLAGNETGRRPRRSMPMTDIVRIASSEIEDYERVDMTAEADARMQGRHALSAAHLIAELLENGCRFSNPGTRVFAGVAIASHGARITITDNGIGMSSDDVANVTAALASTSDDDFIKTDKLGFAVVGRLSRKLQAHVSINSEPDAGTTITVDFPRELFELTPEGEMQPIEAEGTPALAPAPEAATALMPPAQPAAHADNTENLPLVAAGAPIHNSIDEPLSGLGGQLDPGSLVGGAPATASAPPPIDPHLLEGLEPYQPSMTMGGQPPLGGASEHPAQMSANDGPVQPPTQPPAAPQPSPPAPATSPGAPADNFPAQAPTAAPTGPHDGAPAGVEAWQRTFVDPAELVAETGRAPSVDDYLQPTNDSAAGAHSNSGHSRYTPPARPSASTILPGGSGDVPTRRRQSDKRTAHPANDQEPAQKKSGGFLNKLFGKSKQQEVNTPEWEGKLDDEFPAATSPIPTQIKSEESMDHAGGFRPTPPTAPQVSSPFDAAQLAPSQPSYDAAPAEEPWQPPSPTAETPVQPKNLPSRTRTPHAAEPETATAAPSPELPAQMPNDAMPQPAPATQPPAQPMVPMPPGQMPTSPAPQTAMPPAQQAPAAQQPIMPTGQTPQAQPLAPPSAQMPPAQPSQAPPMPTRAPQPTPQPAAQTPAPPAAVPPAAVPQDDTDNIAPMDMLASDKLAYGSKSTGIGKNLRQRSELASQALAELSMLNAYEPEQGTGSTGAGSLARRQRGAASVPPPADSGPRVPSRPRDASNVRSTLSNFSRGVAKGKKKRK